MKAAIVILLLIIIWLVLDFILGRKKHLKHVRKIETPVVHGDLDIFPHGRKLFAEYFSDLQTAKRNIHVLFYIVKNDSFSQEFLKILQKKAREGVEVRLLADRLGSIHLSKKSIKELREAGVQFTFSNPIKLPFLFYSTQLRNHRKITIIDGKIGYMGGFNVGKEYIDEDPKLTPWRDYHLKMTGQCVTFLQNEFLIDWRDYTKENLLTDSNFFGGSRKGTNRMQFVPSHGLGLEEIFLGLIRKAEKSIIIGTPYFIPSKKLLDELIRAAHRGVSITILVPYMSDHPLVKEASYRPFRRLLKEGIVVLQFKNGFYHAKTIVVDDKVCDIGTANFDKRSLFLNKEINCLIYDLTFISRFKDILQRDIQESSPLSLAEINKPNLLRTVKEWVAGAVSYFL